MILVEEIDMSMSKTDVLIEAIQSKVTDEQATSWVAQLGDILDEQDKLLGECYEFILNNVGVQDEYIDYEGKYALLKRLKGE